MDPQRQGFRKTLTNLSVILHIFCLTFLWASYFQLAPGHPLQPYNLKHKLWQLGGHHPTCPEAVRVWKYFRWACLEEASCCRMGLRFLAWPCVLSSLCLSTKMRIGSLSDLLHWHPVLAFHGTHTVRQRAVKKVLLRQHNTVCLSCLITV